MYEDYILAQYWEPYKEKAAAYGKTKEDALKDVPKGLEEGISKEMIEFYSLAILGASTYYASIPGSKEVGWVPEKIR